MNKALGTVHVEVDGMIIINQLSQKCCAMLWTEAMCLNTLHMYTRFSTAMKSRVKKKSKLIIDYL
jgi:hypothetical protein